MKASGKCKDLIKKYEGCELEAYKCPAGIWTVGYGHTDANVTSGTVITQEEADKLFDKDILKFEKAVTRMVKTIINQNQFDALVSFAFNLGSGALLNSTLLKKLNSGDKQGAANEFDRWVYGNNKTKLEGLVRRRKEEKELFLS